MSASRNETFQKLKPPCVGLSQVALNFGTRNADPKEVVSSVRKLLEILTDIKFLDEKLADYVFFPLSHIFRQSQKLPELALELSLKCLQILLARGWNKGIEFNLAKQLLILFALIAGGTPDKPRTNEASEDLRVAALDCISSLFKALRNVPKSQQAFTEAPNIPALGHAVTAIIDSAAEGTSAQVQLSAITALASFLAFVDDQEVLATFFPGIVSALAKCLQPTTQLKRSYKVLQASFESLKTILLAVIDDASTKSLRGKAPGTVSKKSNEKTNITPSWLQITAAQTKLALASVVKIRVHNKPEVRHALQNLCESVLLECKHSLSESASLMVETLIILSGAELAYGPAESESTLRQIAMTDPDIIEIIKSSLHTWIVALPRVIQSNDDDAKRKIASQISIAIRILSTLGISSGIIDSKIVSGLRDSVTSIIHHKSTKFGGVAKPSLELVPIEAAELTSAVFEPIIISHTSQQGPLEILDKILQQVAESPSNFAITRDLVDSIQFATGTEQLTNFWLSINILKHSLKTQHNVDDLFDFGTHYQLPSARLEELYALSLNLLSDSSYEEPHEWRVIALALETLAMQAECLKLSFRTELIDALYPAVHLVGSPSPLLRHHAIVCLNIMAKACKYSSTSEMLVANADYLVNAIALKLNAFDISPQAPQVLLMLIKLAGSSLLPYLDDLVGSIFTALESFHGYPKLVEILFAVLGGIVEEGAKAPAMLLTSGTEINHRKTGIKHLSFDDVIEKLAESRARAEARQAENASHPTKKDGFPREPWKSSSSKIEELDSGSEDADAENDNVAPTPETAPPPSKTYTLISRIALLCQHYLTHSSAQLRLHVLSTLLVSFPPLARTEDSFLPLVATLWPVLAPRISDTEPFVRVRALETLTVLCTCAGDFLASRVAAEWEGWREMYGAVEGQMRRERRAGGRAVYAQSYRVWDAWVGFLVGVLWYVRVEEEVVDDLLDMLGEYLSRAEVREALERRNADAVWVWEVGRGKVVDAQMPVLEGVVFTPVSI
ncbi:MAG: hypothetical protein M1829_001938 [Trizodia sp. TS-e1964]|nr:MAG: hypothetical protein M1829_001938 [Trizodia sp. TS-e1964]